MIITISGPPGSGKSTIAKALAKKLKLKHVSAGDFMREIAKERGVSVLELSKEAERSNKLDKEIDERTKKLGKTKDNFVMDGRMAWYFIPSSVKVFLKVTKTEAARRIFNAKRDDEHARTLAETKREIRKRALSERKRYQMYYGTSYEDVGHYDCVVNTTNKEEKEVINTIISCLKKKKI